MAGVSDLNRSDVNASSNGDASRARFAPTHRRSVRVATPMALASTPRSASVGYMTTKRRGRVSTAKPKADARPETLKTFSATLDEHAGEPVGFDDVVVRLAVTRVAIKQLKAARADLFAHVKRAYEVGHRVVPEAGMELRMTNPGEPTAVRAVASAVAKKADPDAWKRAQVRKRWVAVAAPASVELACPVIETPPTREFIAPAEAVILYKEHPAWEKLRRLADQEEELIERLDKIAANFGWDGEPMVFADGWSVGLVRLQFSSDRLAETDPALFDQLAETSVRQAPSRLVVRRVTDTGDEDDGD